MKKFKQCIIHIGAEKTGTTTLQLFFKKNRVNLAKNGILFPNTFGEDNQFKLTAYARDIQKIDDLRMNLGLINEELVQKFRKNFVKSFKHEVNNNNLSKLLISSEHLQSRLQTVEEVQRVKNFLDEFVETYKIIVYIRPQHEMAISQFSTKCRLGLTEEKILPNIGPNNLYYNFEKLLNRWETVFGFDNITVKIFSKNEFPEGDIKKDFVKFLELDWNNFKDVKNENESIDIEAQKFLLEINKFLPQFIENKKNKIRGDIAELVIHESGEDGLLPTREQTERFFQIFRNSNEEVRKKWFPQREELFNFDLSKYSEKPIPKTDYKFAFKIFAKVWELKQRQLLAAKEKKLEFNKIKEQIMNKNLWKK